MIDLRPVTKENFSLVYKRLIDAFPYEERRDEADEKKCFLKSQFNFCEITDDGEIIRNPLVNMAFADEMIAINEDYAGYVSIPGVMSEAVVQADDNEYYLKKNNIQKQSQTQ